MRPRTPGRRWQHNLLMRSSDRDAIEKRVFKDCGSYWTLRELGRARYSMVARFKVVLMSCLRKDAKVGSAIVRDLACKSAANSSLSCCGMTG